MGLKGSLEIAIAHPSETSLPGQRKPAEQVFVGFCGWPLPLKKGAEPTGLEPATEINIKATEKGYLTFRDTFVTVLHEKVTSTEKTTTR